MTERAPHAAVLRAPARHDLKAVAAVLAAGKGLPPETMMPVARRDWGLLGEPSAAEDAERLAASLTAAGQDAVAVPVSLIEEPASVVIVTKAELSGDGFDVAAGKGEAVRERLVWTHLKVLSAGSVTETSTKTVTEGPSLAEKSVRLGVTLATGLPMMGGKTTTRQVKDEKRLPFIELVFAEPARRVRIMAAEFDYTALGTKMSYSAELNFRVLAAELAARAPGALRSRGLRAVLEKAPSGALAYDSFDDVRREERWLLTLVTLGTALP